MGRDLPDHDKTHNHTDNKTNANPSLAAEKKWRHLLAGSSFAAPLRLSGDFGLAIQGTIDLNNSTNMANTTNETQLWSRGKLPVGHFITLPESWRLIRSMTMV